MRSLRKDKTTYSLYNNLKLRDLGRVPWVKITRIIGEITLKVSLIQDNNLNSDRSWKNSKNSLWIIMSWIFMLTTLRKTRWQRVLRNQVSARVSWSSRSWATSGRRPTRELCRIKSCGGDRSSISLRSGGRSPASSPRSTWTTGTSMIALRSSWRISRLRSRRSSRVANFASSSSPEWWLKQPPQVVRIGNLKRCLKSMGSHAGIPLMKIQLRQF